MNTVVSRSRLGPQLTLPESYLVVVHMIQEGASICGAGQGVAHRVPYPTSLVLLSRNLQQWVVDIYV